MPKDMDAWRDRGRMTADQASLLVQAIPVFAPALVVEHRVGVANERRKPARRPATLGSVFAALFIIGIQGSSCASRSRSCSLSRAPTSSGNERRVTAGRDRGMATA